MDSRLDAIRDAPTILAAIHRTLDLASSSADLPDPAALERAIDDPSDSLTAIAAIHLAAAHRGSLAGDLLARRLDDPRPFVREHAILALSTHPARRVDDHAATAIVDAIAGGGLTGMVAQLTVERLARRSRMTVAWLSFLGCAISGTKDPIVRARLVESLGLLKSDDATATLARIARDPGESLPVRVAAIAALGDRPGVMSIPTVRGLVGADGIIGATARLALHDLVGGRPTTGRNGTGLRIAQLYLHAELDAELTTAGMGETGGIATLLVRLGDALVARPDVEFVTTISRGTPDRALATLEAPGTGHSFAAVPFGQGVPQGIGHAWPGLVDARRGIRRILRAHAPLDRLHLRMADVGSLAGSMAARAEGVATTFSLAPDPHALLAAMERSGELTRAGFGAADHAGHFWFRVALVRRLVEGATHVALFPRPDLEAQMADLIGIDIARDRRRFTVVPEGIDTSGIDAASGALAPRWPDVEAVLSAVPLERRHLPLVMTVGRMHDIKGMSRVVAAWASDAALSECTNLLVVGGDLVDPSPDEAAELARIEAVVRGSRSEATGLLLAGHRSNGTVSRLLVAARQGYAGFAARGGVYVCGSRKEEFGLAIVEALAAGLPVVVPRVGGPATYVDDGVTGSVVDTADPSAIAEGIARALAMAPDDGRARRARDLVHRRFTVQAMADTMAAVYAAPVPRPSSQPADVPVESRVQVVANVG